ncbi:MAG: CHAT domain-containing protein [Myxococcales bacterium]|nr:CHAT domain-containing protein [Myxococcales bacterium]
MSIQAYSDVTLATATEDDPPGYWYNVIIASGSTSSTVRFSIAGMSSSGTFTGSASYIYDGWSSQPGHSKLDRNRYDDPGATGWIVVESGNVGQFVNASNDPLPTTIRTNSIEAKDPLEQGGDPRGDFDKVIRVSKGDSDLTFVYDEVKAALRNNGYHPGADEVREAATAYVNNDIATGRAIVTGITRGTTELGETILRSAGESATAALEVLILGVAAGWDGGSPYVTDKPAEEPVVPTPPPSGYGGRSWGSALKRLIGTRRAARSTFTVVLTRDHHLCVSIDGTPLRSTHVDIPDLFVTDIQQALKDATTQLVNSPQDTVARRAFEDSLRTIGERLGNVLFRRMGMTYDDAGPPLSPLGLELWRHLDDLDGTEFVRLLLGFEDPTLGGLPWELVVMTDPEGFPLRLATDQRLAVSRISVRHAASLRKAARRTPLRMLGVVSDPTVLGLTSLEQETKQIQAAVDRALTDAVNHGRAVVRWVPSQQLETALENVPKETVLWFLGHGFETPAGRFGLQFAAEVPGSPGQVTAVALDTTAIIRRLVEGPVPWLVALIACYGAGDSTESSAVLANPQQAFAAEGIPATLAMTGSLRIAAAPILTEAFFDAVGAGQPLDYAVQHTRRALEQFGELLTPESLPDQWYKPSLLVAQTEALRSLLTDGAPLPDLLHPPVPDEQNEFLRILQEAERAGKLALTLPEGPIAMAMTQAATHAVMAAASGHFGAPSVAALRQLLDQYLPK